MEISGKTRLNFIKSTKKPTLDLTSPILMKNRNPTFIFLLFLHHMSRLLEINSQEERPRGNNGLLFLENP